VFLNSLSLVFLHFGSRPVLHAKIKQGYRYLVQTLTFSSVRKKKKYEIVTRIGEVGGVVEVEENGVRNGGAEIKRQRRIKFLQLVENVI